jgi:hypothetical protein
MNSRIFKFEDFSLNEAKSDKELSKGAKDIIKMLEGKPSVKMDTFENEKGAYTLSGIKTHLNDKYTSAKIDQFIHEIQNSKKVNLKNIRIKNYKYNEYYPYYYIGDFDAKEYKTELEKNSKDRYAEETLSRNELIKKKQQHEVELKAKKKKRSTGRKKSLRENVMKFREYTFGIKEDIDLDIEQEDINLDDMSKDEIISYWKEKWAGTCLEDFPDRFLDRFPTSEDYRDWEKDNYDYQSEDDEFEFSPDDEVYNIAMEFDIDIGDDEDYNYGKDCKISTEDWLDFWNSMWSWE